jgi:hypothetical protein
MFYKVAVLIAAHAVRWRQWARYAFRLYGDQHDRVVLLMRESPMSRQLGTAQAAHAKSLPDSVLRLQVTHRATNRPVALSESALQDGKPPIL